MNAITLRTMMGDYPLTRALKSGDLVSPHEIFGFADVKTPNTAFDHGCDDDAQTATTSMIEETPWQ